MDDDAISWSTKYKMKRQFSEENREFSFEYIEVEENDH